MHNWELEPRGEDECPCSTCGGNGDILIAHDRARLCRHCNGTGIEPVYSTEEDAEEAEYYEYGCDLADFYAGR